MRLIDADELIKRECKNCSHTYEDCHPHCFNVSFIDESPTIDPIIHAGWIEESGTIVCSHCKHKRNTADREYTMYCGHCGAKMGVQQ